MKYFSILTSYYKLEYSENEPLVQEYIYTDVIKFTRTIILLHLLVLLKVLIDIYLLTV